MFDHTIRRMLLLFPRGATDDQLIWRLNVSGIRVNPSELLAGLGALAQRGEIVRDAYGRWRASAPPAPSAPNKVQAHAGAAPDDHSGVLYAVEATCRPTDRASSAVDTAEQGTATFLPDWAPLFSYYAATQRKDPRGQIQEFADRHGLGWQLFRTSGPWWGNAAIRIGMEQLREPFREALTRQKISSAAIGWPISIFRTSEGETFIPGLIVPVDLGIQGADLVDRRPPKVRGRPSSP